MRWVELGADGRGDDGVRREDAVQPAEDDRLHTVAAALMTLRRHLDSQRRWNRRLFSRLAHEQPRQRLGAPSESASFPGRPEPPRAARCPHSEVGTAEGVAS